MRGLRSILVALLLIGAATVAAKAEPAVPPLTGAVVDLANLLPASEERDLTHKLEGIEARTGAQVVIVTLPSLQGYAIETWGITLGRSWKIGRAGKDDGILIIVAPEDREVRIEVGYGLEGDIPDASAHRIITGTLLPAFRGGHFARGLGDAVDTLERLIVSPGVPIGSQTRPIGLYIAVLFSAGIVLMLIIAFHFFPLGSGLAAAAGKDDQSNRDDSDSLFSHSSSDSSFSSSSSHSSFSGHGGSFGGGGASGKW